VKKKNQKLYNRTGYNKCAICHEFNLLVQHHIRGRKIPNCNHKSNIANICSNCHNKVHNGIIIIEDYILTDLGYELVWHYFNEESKTGNDAKPWLIP
jgi:hypothetical protein